MKRIKIGTRASRLALIQTELILSLLKEHHPQYEYEVVKIQTKGDLILDQTLDKIGGKGLFVKEIQHALLEKEVDLAVHSMKDLPVVPHPELVLAAMPRREDPRDVLVTRAGIGFAELPSEAVIGSSSLRRQAQLLSMRPDLQVVSIRGNVETRLSKVVQGQVDGAVLAAAGLNRLGLTDRIQEWFALEVFTPAVGQGAIGCEIRKNDEELAAMLQPLNHQETVLAVAAERSFLAAIEGSCHLPVGAYGQVTESGLRLTGMVAAPDGSEILKETLEAELHSGVVVGRLLAERLTALGGKELLSGR